MGTRSRVKTVQIQRQQRVSLLLESGWTQEQIAGELKVDEATVSRDVATLRAQWQQAGQEATATRMIRELARLDRDEADLRALLTTTTGGRALWIWDRIAKIQDLRGKWLGFGPATALATGPTTALDAAIAALDREENPL